MNILAFSFYFPPHGGPGALRPLKMLKYLAQLGAEGVVIASAESDYSVIDETLCAEIPEEFLVMRTPIDADPLRFLRKRMQGKIHAPSSDLFLLPDNKIWWIRVAERLGEIALPDADIVWATCPPFSAGIAAKKAAKALGVPLVLDFRDSWTNNPNRKRLPFTHRLYNHNLAQRTASSANLITCVYNSIADEMHQLAPNSRIEVLPNGFDPVDMPKHIPQSNSDSRLKICYLGTIYPNLNYPMPFLKTMVNYPEIELSVIGRYPQEFADDVDKLGLSNRVHLKGYLPHKQALSVCSEHDVMLIYIDGRPLNMGQVTSKTYEYIGLGKPILACIPSGGEADILLRNIDNAFVVETDSESSISIGLQKILSQKINGILNPITPSEKFNRKLIASKFFEMLEDTFRISHY